MLAKWGINNSQSDTKRSRFLGICQIVRSSSQVYCDHCRYFDRFHGYGHSGGHFVLVDGMNSMSRQVALCLCGIPGLVQL